MRPQVGHLNSYSGIRFPIIPSPIRLAVLPLLGSATVAALTAGRSIRHDVALALVAVQDASAGATLTKPTDISRLAQVFDHFLARRAARFTGCGSGVDTPSLILPDWMDWKSGSHFSA
jgi:hypothetical protein